MDGCRIGSFTQKLDLAFLGIGVCATERPNFGTASNFEASSHAASGGTMGKKKKLLKIAANAKKKAGKKMAKKTNILRWTGQIPLHHPHSHRNARRSKIRSPRGLK
jgi:hypothetical protein